MNADPIKFAKNRAYQFVEAQQQALILYEVKNPCVVLGS